MKNVIHDNMECACYQCQFEDLWLDLSIHGQRCLVSVCYRHPRGNITHFLGALKNTLTQMNNMYDITCFAGDMNIDLIPASSLPANDDYLKLLLLHQFMPTISIPTRITDSSMTLIDHIFVKVPSHKISTNIVSGAMYCDISDHLPIFCCLNVSNRTCNERPLVRLYNDKNYQNFIQSVEITKFDDILSMDDPDRAYECLGKTLQTLHDTHFPLVRLSRSKFKNKPWVTPAIKKSINHKNVLYRQFINDPQKDRKTKLARYRLILNKTLKAAEAQYYKSILSSRETSSRQVWNTINGLINNRNKKKDAGISLLEHNNNKYTDKLDIANAFNNYFSTIGSKLANEIPNCNTHFTMFMDKPVLKTIYLRPVCEHEIISEIDDLKIGKAPGFDCINNKMLKVISPTVVPILTHIFNLCFTKGIYPSSLKKAKLIPLFKKGNQTLPENYRPISLLPCINKLLEKVIDKRLRNFLQENNVFYDYQFGFRAGHSTSQALLEITTHVLRNTLYLLLLLLLLLYFSFELSSFFVSFLFPFC